MVDSEILLLVQNLSSILICLSLICINLYAIQFKNIAIDVLFLLFIPIVILFSYEYDSLNFTSILLTMLIFFSVSVNSISIMNIRTIGVKKYEY